MVSFGKINRRTHLYLGLFLLPWLTMYGISSAIVIHQSWFNSAPPLAKELAFEKSYNRPVDLKGANNSPELRAAAQQILRDIDMEGAFWADKPNPDSLHIDRFSFRGSTSLTYSARKQTIKAEHQRMRTPQVIMRMHFRGGYDQPSFGNKSWGLLVDLACVGILIWIISGLIMWWQLPRLRMWGIIALTGGVLSFLLLIWTL
ncbi:MAG TPA: hypothetical protein VGP94_10335 [Tepidisphaeraceae bacterium]|jgi:hypothetical protein|nr:hypothetical protein [Tepidisphaeraceae bacterium]